MSTPTDEWYTGHSRAPLAGPSRSDDSYFPAPPSPIEPGEFDSDPIPRPPTPPDHVVANRVADLVANHVAKHFAKQNDWWTETLERTYQGTPTRSRITQPDGPLIRFAEAHADDDDDDGDDGPHIRVGLARHGKRLGFHHLERPVTPTRPSPARSAYGPAFHTPTRITSAYHGEITITPRARMVRAPVRRGLIDFSEPIYEVHRLEERDGEDVEWEGFSSPSAGATGEGAFEDSSSDSVDDDDESVLFSSSPTAGPSSYMPAVDVPRVPLLSRSEHGDGLYACHALCDGTAVKLRAFDGRLPTFDCELDTGISAELLGAIQVLDMWTLQTEEDLSYLLMPHKMGSIHTLRVYTQGGDVFPSHTLRLRPKALVFFTTVHSAIDIRVKARGICNGVPRLVINASTFSDKRAWADDWFPCVVPYHVEELVIIFDPSRDVGLEKMDALKSWVEKFAQTVGENLTMERKVTLVNLPDGDDLYNAAWFRRIALEKWFQKSESEVFRREHVWAVLEQTAHNNIEFLTGPEYAAKIGPEQLAVETCRAMGNGHDIRTRELSLL